MKKRKKSVAGLITLLLLMGGAVILTVWLTRPKAYCTMHVATGYSGWGIEGQFLGRGSFDQEFRVKSGDCLYELGDGVWELNPKHNMFYEKIVEITEVKEDGVTAWIYRNGTVTMPYEQEKEIESTFTVYDGINYYHEMHFSGYVVQ